MISSGWALTSGGLDLFLLCSPVSDPELKESVSDSSGNM